ALRRKTRSPRRPRRSSARWPKPTHRAERQEFTVNCSTRHRYRRAQRLPLHATKGTQASLADLAHLPRQPYRFPLLDRHFTVPTATFRVLYVFLVLSHDRRRVLHWNVTSDPARTGPPSRSL